MAAGGPATAAGMQRGLCDGRDGGESLRAGGGASCRAQGRGLERRGAGPFRRAPDHGHCRRGGASLGDEVAGHPRARAFPRREGAGGRPGPDARRPAAEDFGAHDRRGPGRQREYRRVRSHRAGLPRGACRGGVGACGWRVRPVGRGHAGAPASDGGDLWGGFVGNGRAQVAERALRLRAGAGAGPAGAAGGDGDHGGISPYAKRVSQPGGLHAGAFPARPRRRGLGGTALAGPRRHRPPDRGQLHAGAALRVKAGGGGLRDSQRGRAQPGARGVWRRGENQPRHRRRAG